MLPTLRRTLAALVVVTAVLALSLVAVPTGQAAIETTCCSECQPIFEACLAGCGGDIECQIGCWYQKDFCDTWCDPGC